VGEPDEKLFQLPPNPIEVTPHEFFAALSLNSDDNLDQRYTKFKAIRGEYGRVKARCMPARVAREANQH